jgi:hypothetical protein
MLHGLQIAWLPDVGVDHLAHWARVGLYYFRMRHLEDARDHADGPA